MYDEKFVERFERKFVKTEGCWNWQASVAGKGYGQVKLTKQRKQEYAHRAAYQIYVGPIPDGLMVLHKCDNPRCVNPGHLWLGTCKDNLQDMAEKNRSTHGERNRKAKLTETDVREILSLKDTMSQHQIAEKFGISQSQIHRIHAGKRWVRISHDQQRP